MKTVNEIKITVDLNYLGEYRAKADECYLIPSISVVPNYNLEAFMGPQPNSSTFAAETFAISTESPEAACDLLREKLNLDRDRALAHNAEVAHRRAAVEACNNQLRSARMLTLICSGAPLYIRDGSVFKVVE